MTQTLMAGLLRACLFHLGLFVDEPKIKKTSSDPQNDGWKAD
jgi:hypothetical protein